MKRAYLAVKFHEDNKNRDTIEDIAKSIEKTEIELIIMARDYEKWGKVHFEPKELMELTFKLIKKSDLLIVEFSEKGVGLGIEAGYAYANKIPILVIAKENSNISNTLKGIADNIVFYKEANELTQKLKEINLH